MFEWHLTSLGWDLQSSASKWFDGGEHAGQRCESASEQPYLVEDEATASEGSFDLLALAACKFRAVMVQ
jgi:hypothetical protein